MQDAFLQQVYRKMQVDNKTKRGNISIFIHRVNNKPDMVGSIKIQEQVDAVGTWTPQMVEVVVCLLAVTKSDRAPRDSCMTTYGPQMVDLS